MIPADLGAELTAAVRAAVAAGELPPAAGQVVPSGTWRPAPAPSPPAPTAMARRYATALPFTLGRIAGRDPREVATALGRAVAGVGWISSAEVTGAGYLTIDVSPAKLAEVAVRVSRAGPCCACSGAVGDPALHMPAGPVPPLPDLAAAPGWRRAGLAQAAAVTARLCRAAVTPLPDGCRLPDDDGKDADTKREKPGAGHARPATGPVASAVRYAGADAVRYWLTRNPSWPDRGPATRNLATRDLANPWYAVTFAQADAAAVRRHAADLGLADPGLADAGRADPGLAGGQPDLAGERLAGLLAEPAELVLLGRLSWLGERVAGAARRARPADLARYLEDLAAAWLDCRESCPALPFGGAAAPREAAGVSARLLLAGATATALAAGLGLIGVRHDLDQLCRLVRIARLK